MIAAGIEIIVVNDQYKDTVGTTIQEGDHIFLWNGNQENKGWSYEKVTKGNDGKLYSVFPKYLGPVYTDLSTIPCNWIMVIKNEDGMSIFHTDKISFKLED